MADIPKSLGKVAMSANSLTEFTNMIGIVFFFGVSATGWLLAQNSFPGLGLE
jgi:hypothetical protein